MKADGTVLQMADCWVEPSVVKKAVLRAESMVDNLVYWMAVRTAALKVANWADSMVDSKGSPKAASWAGLMA